MFTDCLQETSQQKTAGGISCRQKKLHIEFLRFACIWLVMFTHTATEGFSLYLNEQSSPWFPLYLTVPFFVKTAVPVFFMISGALLLGKEEPVSVIFHKRILRFAAVLVIFSFLNYVIDYRSVNIPRFLFLVYTSTLATAYYFLYIYIAFLMMLPFWRAMVKNLTHRHYVYLIALELIFVGVVPISSFLMFKGSAQMNYFLNPLLAVSEPTFYFLIGYWIENVMPDSWLSNKALVFWGAAAAAGTAAAACMTVYNGTLSGQLTEANSERFYDCFLFLNTGFVYCCAKRFFLHRQISMNVRRILVFLGSMSFGVMLLDDLLRHSTMGIFHRHILSLLSGWPLTAAVLWITLAFSLGIVVVYFIKKIPLFRELI
jgi:surface polysaccharide O-acyltransferase-like enzyme